ncbi:MAG: D-aminoacylase [Candidatus Dormibacteraeota bacterium]|nr:D-aminoacylase [Candidatus Dormibacteraeota bacterium]
MEFDVIVRGGTVFDGRGSPPTSADIGIVGDRIATVGSLEAATAANIVEATGLSVAPGFIDSHTHSDMACFLGAEHEDVVMAALRQGVTTEVCGNCGFSPFPCPPGRGAELERHLGTLFASAAIEWSDLAGYSSALHRRGLTGNLAPLVGHGSLRAAVLGFEDRPAKHEELVEMTRLLDEALEQGALGLSSGLVYMPGAAAASEELVALARSVGRHHRLYTSHIRGETDMVAESVAEAIQLGREASVPVHISHHKVCGRQNYGRTEETLELVTSSRRAGLDVSVDVYPYTAASTLLYAMLPNWVQAGGLEAMVDRLRDSESRERIRREFEDGPPEWQNIPRAAGWEGIVISNCPGNPALEGRSVSELAADAGTTAPDYVFDLLVEQRGQVMMIIHMMDEADVRRVLAYDAAMIGSDGIPLPGKPHPRWAGTFARVLGHYSRELGLLDQSTAIRKMTSMTAERFGLAGRGTLTVGAYADLVVFDSARVIDTASFESPLTPPIGIRHVFVNGRHVIKDEAFTGARPGRVVGAA